MYFTLAITTSNTTIQSQTPPLAEDGVKSAKLLARSFPSNARCEDGQWSPQRTSSQHILVSPVPHNGVKGLYHRSPLDQARFVGNAV